MRTLFGSVDQLQDAMTFHRERHSVLAGNVANIDTPGYQPADLARVPAASPEGAPAATNPGHLATAPGAPGSTLAFVDGQDAGADGNAVSLERELAKIDANRVRYAASAELASRRLALLRYTAGDGG
jgi:flagellar basal-body rod protein FlgB